MPAPGTGPIDPPIVDSTGSRYSLVVEDRGITISLQTTERLYLVRVD